MYARYGHTRDKTIKSFKHSTTHTLDIFVPKKTNYLARLDPPFFPLAPFAFDSAAFAAALVLGIAGSAVMTGAERRLEALRGCCPGSSPRLRLLGGGSGGDGGGPTGDEVQGTAEGTGKADEAVGVKADVKSRATAPAVGAALAGSAAGVLVIVGAAKLAELSGATGGVGTAGITGAAARTGATGAGAGTAEATAREAGAAEVVADGSQPMSCLPVSEVTAPVGFSVTAGTS